MDKTYNPRAIEQHWYRIWDERGYFAPRPARPGAGSFCIMIPPPNVTGSLHMGHAFQDTLMDTLVRYHRMRGDATLWQAGSDHAGIATQMVVERQLAGEGSDRVSLGRERFVERVWQWKAESGNAISGQLRRLGASLDWSRERFTMDEGLSRAVREVFVRLHEEGLVYRGKRLVNWDPVLKTAISDLEVVSEEERGHLWHLRYPLADADGEPSGEYLVVATTRPETMLGDTAVAVHPEDERYRHLIGRRVCLPLTGRLIPVIGDDYVDPEFGTGCLKITPGHDFNDYAVGQRHSLPLINVFTPDARIGDRAPEPYRGLDRFDARERIVEDLRAQGLLEAVTDHTLMVPRGDRTGEILEPYLTDQWFVRVKPLAGPAIEAVERGDIRFVPGNWARTYFEWMRNIEDWCISRQIWWGHRIPAWYDPDGNVHVGRSEAEARRRGGLTDDVPLEQDHDVLDTWFSSALWPFSTLGWPEDTQALRTFYPTSVLVTGFDIIFFWVARMIMMGLKFTGEVPFRDVYIHGLVRDSDGQKMSKSKGNVLDPIDLIDGIDLESLVAKRTRGLMQPQMARSIEKATRRHFPHGIPAFGTDALRFTFAALASTGRDIRFDLNRVEGYRNFCNKLWNAARYVLMNTDGQDLGADAGERSLSQADRWILSRLSRTIDAVHEHIAAYRFDLMAHALYEFVWDEYCDWYLELSKATLHDDGADARARRGTRHTLLRVLDGILRLLHPLMPFITEEIWQRVAPLLGAGGDAPETICLQPCPEPGELARDDAAETEMQWVMEFVLGLRRIRGEMDIAPGRALPVVLQDADPRSRERVDSHRAYLDSLGRLESIRFLDAGETPPQAATALLGRMKILVPMAGLIDTSAELERLDRQMAKLEQNLGRTRRKLANDSFVQKAPAEVVDKERARLDSLSRSLDELRAQRERIAALD
ncbi:MAG TPA: valine--tRNA ligase [Gammaproteobacteria bacterium]|nr:valine--tRNA ligase [Gammaproteobacteria bacterium]